LKRYGYAGIDASSRVRRFMLGIKTNKLDHTQASVNGNRHLKKDFERVVQVYKDFITQASMMTELLLCPMVGRATVATLPW
jgi:hypothetical protein